MDFSNIDFPSVEIHSKNVFLYFRNFTTTNIKKIESLKQKEFKTYADKHSKSIDEILSLYDTGFNEGIEKAKNSIEEKNKISSEGGMFYLFEIASIYNLELKYYSRNTSEKLRCQDIFEPKIIIDIGLVIGEFYFSWLQVLDSHRIFEPLFKKEIDKTKNNFFNKPFFPVHNVKIAELPESMNYAKDFAVTLERMNDITEINLSWLDNGTMDKPNMSRRLRYDILKDLKSQFYNFLQETTNNTNNGIFEKHISFYQRIDGELKKCIELFNTRAKKYFTMDMSFIYKYHIYNKNWFVIVLDYLKQTNESFERIAKFDNLLTGFTCTLHPDTVKEIFNLMLNHLPKPQIEGELEDFQAIFSNTQTHVKNPVKWLIKHGKGANKTALFTFIKMMLQKDEMPIKIIKQSNNLFKYGKENIFPEKYYPDIKEQQSNYKTHFKQIKQTYFPDFLKD